MGNQMRSAFSEAFNDIKEGVTEDTPETALIARQESFEFDDDGRSLNEMIADGLYALGMYDVDEEVVDELTAAIDSLFSSVPKTYN